MTIPETLFQKKCSFPNSLVNIRHNRCIDVFMFHYIEVFIGSIVIFVLLYSHKKFFADKLFSILMRSHSCVDEFNYLSGIFEFKDVMHHMRHHFTYIFEVDLLVLHNTCLLYTSPSPRDQRGSRMPSSA